MSEIKYTTLMGLGEAVECEPKRMIVKLKSRDATRQKEVLSDILGRDTAYRFVHEPDEDGIALIEFDSTEVLEKTASQRIRTDEVEYAVPNQIVRGTATTHGHVVTFTPGDSEYRRQWALPKIGMPRAWPLNYGKRVRPVIGVIDSGMPVAGNPLRIVHEDFADHPQPARKRFFFGTNFINPGQAPFDDSSHGTHVTGIIGAAQGDRVGIVGVDWLSPVFANKALDSAGLGTTFGILQAVREAVAFAANLKKRLVLNFSIGANGYHPVWEEVARAAADAVIVAAAGNTGGPVEFPGALSTRPDGSTWYSNVLAVSATDRNDAHWPISNRGPQINVAAPGVDILSTIPYNPYDPSAAKYEERTGTSMAAPHVSGVAAMLFARWSGYITPAQVRSIIEKSCVDLGPPGRDELFGFGRIDALKAMQVNP